MTSRVAVSLWLIHLVVTVVSALRFIDSIYRHPVPLWVSYGPVLTGSTAYVLVFPALWRGVLSGTAVRMGALGSLLLVFWCMGLTRSPIWGVVAVLVAASMIVGLGRSVLAAGRGPRRSATGPSS